MGKQKRNFLFGIKTAITCDEYTLMCIELLERSYLGDYLSIHIQSFCDFIVVGLIGDRLLGVQVFPLKKKKLTRLV